MKISFVFALSQFHLCMVLKFKNRVFLLYHAKEKTHFYMKSSTVKDLNHQPLWPLQ